MCLSYWLQVSEGVECGPAGFMASSSFCCFPWLPLCWNVTGWEFSQQGFFPVGTTDSIWSLGTAPS